jgi:hypothetical protein
LSRVSILAGQAMFLRRTSLVNYNGSYHALSLGQQNTGPPLLGGLFDVPSVVGILDYAIIFPKLESSSSNNQKQYESEKRNEIEI